MQRRPSHPHGQLTGMIVVVSLMLSVGIMFWVPGASPAPTAAVAAGTPTLPAAPAVTRTPRPDPNAPVAAQAPAPVEPTMDWSAVPTAIPEDQLLAQAPVQPAPVYVPAAPVVVYQQDNSAVVAAQQAQAAAEAQAQAAAQAQAQAEADAQAARDAQAAQARAALEQAQRDAARIATAQASIPNTDPGFGSKPAADREENHTNATAQP